MRPKALTRRQMLSRLSNLAGSGDAAALMRLLADYAGASHFLLARCDLMDGEGRDCIVTSDWPYDLARRLSADMADEHNRSTELERCLALLSPRFSIIPDEVALPQALDRQYCMLSFCVGRERFSLLLLFAEGIVLSRERLREAALFSAYGASFVDIVSPRRTRDYDLTERELECLFWIAEGKTSEEIALILGISRNTINNYITSVMRKTVTRTRSEAIAHAVRNNLL